MSITNTITNRMIWVLNPKLNWDSQFGSLRWGYFERYSYIDLRESRKSSVFWQVRLLCPHSLSAHTQIFGCCGCQWNGVASHLLLATSGTFITPPPPSSHPPLVEQQCLSIREKSSVIVLSRGYAPTNCNVVPNGNRYTAQTVKDLHEAK